MSDASIMASLNLHQQSSMLSFPLSASEIAAKNACLFYLIIDELFSFHTLFLLGNFPGLDATYKVGFLLQRCCVSIKK